MKSKLQWFLNNVLKPYVIGVFLGIVFYVIERLKNGGQPS